MCSISGFRKNVQKLATKGLDDDTIDQSHTKALRHKYGVAVERCLACEAVVSKADGVEGASSVLRSFL
jgi:hypothetical protein